MAIKIMTVQCPSCGASLTAENGKTISFCSYCGSGLIINNENEHIIRNIDEARIKEAETDRLIRLKELEIEEAEKARKRKIASITYGVALAFVVIGILMCLLGADSGIGLIVLGFYVAMFGLIIQFGKQKKKKLW